MSVVVIILLIMLGTGFIFGAIAGGIASGRFRSYGFFWIGFFFGLIGVIIVALAVADHSVYMKSAGIIVEEEAKNETNDEEQSYQVTHYYYSGIEISYSDVKRVTQEWVMNNPELTAGIAVNAQEQTSKIDDIESELLKLDELLSKKLITVAEYDKLRKELI